MKTFARVLPYFLSWGVLGVLMVIGMDRVPIALYTPIDGEWAKWNAEAILHFGKVFDLSPHSMLAGMGSTYLPNLPWLNPGALALALPLGDNEKNIASYAVYGAELAVSIVLLARVIGFSWLTATAAAQLHLYLLFPPFSEVFRILNWYSLIPYFAHLTAALNSAAVVLLVCGRTGDSRRNVVLLVGFSALIISGLLSAPFHFIFATPPYLVICAVLIVMHRSSSTEWAWKIAALLTCLVFFFTSGLLNYYYGTVATAARTPSVGVTWDHLLSPDAWLRLFRDHPLCQDALLLLCIKDRGAWLQVAGLIGASLAISTQRGDIRTTAWTLIVYIGFAHVYAYAYQAGWLGPAGVLSIHFLIWSSLSFVCMFAVIALFDPLIKPNTFAPSKASEHKQLARVAANLVLVTLLLVIVVNILSHPYGSYRYRIPQLVTGGAAIGALLLATAIIRTYRSKKLIFSPATPMLGWRHMMMLSTFPILALVHLSMGVREDIRTARDPSLRNYLSENAAIELERPFRGYAATIWMDKSGKIAACASNKVSGDTVVYICGRDYFSNHYGETFTETDLWRSNIPTFEEYGQWTSLQAHTFASRLLAPEGIRTDTRFLRAYKIDSDILRLLGVRYILTDAEMLDKPAIVRGSVAALDALSVRLFELPDTNLATYSPRNFVKAVTVDAIVDRIRENKEHLDQIAVVSDDVPPTIARARNMVMTVERDGFRIRAESDGPAHIIVPVQFSHCLVVVNGTTVRLARVNLFQTLMSFEGKVDVRIEFRFGLFADNKCRLRDGLDNQALGL